MNDIILHIILLPNTRVSQSNHASGAIAIDPGTAPLELGYTPSIYYVLIIINSQAPLICPPFELHVPLSIHFRLFLASYHIQLAIIIMLCN